MGSKQKEPEKKQTVEKTRQNLLEMEENLKKVKSDLKKTKEKLTNKQNEVKQFENEKSQLQKEYEEKIKSLEKNKENEKIRLENEKRKYEFDMKEQEKEIYRIHLKKFEEEKKMKELEIRIMNEKREKNEGEIKRFRDSQDIALFLELIERFNNELDYLVKVLEALDEEAVVNKYKAFEGKIKGKIQIIKARVYDDYKLSRDCERKLIIILLCIEKNNFKCDDVLEKIFNMGSNKKELLFSVLLDYSKEFGKDVYFKEDKIYEEFVDYSLKNRKYLESLDYRSDDIIQLKILYAKREAIFNTNKIIDKILKLNEYDGAHEIIQKIIKYEKSKQKKFVSFKRTFWENYFIYSKINEDNINKIPKLVEIYNLLLSYIDLGNDDTEFKEILAQKIHEIIIKRLEEIPIARNQLEFLFKYDPYYTSSCYERNPEIIEKINILELNEEEDIDYFTNLNLEKVYSKVLTNYLNVLIKKIEEIEDFNSIIKIIKINQKENREKYINLLSERYSQFPDEKLTTESFINFFKKVLEYNPKIKHEILEKHLPRFGQQNKIYLKLFEIFETNDEIKEQIAVLSVNNLDLSILIELIINMKNEEIKIDYFNNLSMKVIAYDDFFKLEASDNLKLLMKLMKKNLIPESNYLEKNKDILQTIYDKLIKYEETNSKYLDTIINEKKEIINIYSERFKLFKLIKGKKYDSKSEFNKVMEKYLEVKKYLEKAYKISNLLTLYYKKTFKKEIDEINNIYNVYSIKDKKVCLWLSKEEEIKGFISKYENKANLINTIKNIKLFLIIYNEFTAGDEKAKFDKAKELLDSFKIIFEEMKIGKVNSEILNKWQNQFGKKKGIDEELKKLKDYYKIENNESLDKIIKNILIFTKKNIYYSDIKCILFFLKLFEVEETDLSKTLKEGQTEFEKKENIDFEKLVNINNFLEEKQIYINEGKEDSPSIKLIRFLNNKENEINFAKTKDVDSASALLYRLNPTTDYLKFRDILEYQSCVFFIKDFISSKLTDEKCLEKLKEKIKKDDINKLLSIFKNYFMNYRSIKMLDSNFDSSKDIYENIKYILNNSEFRIEFFKREFKIYDDNNKEKEIIVHDLDGLIQLKDNINLNFEDLPDNNNVNEKGKEELKEKRAKVEIFVRYVEQLRNLNQLFSKLENKGCPFLIDILVIAKNDKITFELVNIALSYQELILKLKQFLLTLFEYQLNFYKENEYFRLIYDKQLYRLFKK